ncbi:MAG: Xaa-Pro aminopeptidase [Bacteroidetes bacterium HGW-Bacteroidetes-17]|nr:MAG: Xaa-Pro aminopeptidase [Bacteroidetes bacterium HGW-Bacteroidetes-17]
MKNLILFLFTFIIVQTQAQILSEKERSEIRDQIIEDRLVNLLPQLMDRADIDMWIVMSREYNEDPVIRSMLPSKWFAARRRTILVFYRDKANNLTERLAVSTYDVGKHIKTAWDKNKFSNQWDALREIIVQRNPKKIGLNYSEHFGIADGLVLTDYNELMKVLPKNDQLKIVSAENLAIGWIETRTELEMKYFAQLVGITHQVIAEAFSNSVITPDKTTTEDVQWWIRDKITALGLETWFHPTIDIQRSNAKLESFINVFSKDTEGEVIVPGDLLHCDVGIQYLGLNSDVQEYAYVLKEGEKEVPEFLKGAMVQGNRLQDIFTSNFVTGKSGNEIFLNSLKDSKAEGTKPSIYSHPLGLYGHSAGAVFGMWDQQDGVPGTGDYTLFENTAYAIELNVSVFLPEWDREIRIMLEEDGMWAKGGFRYINGRQTEIFKIYPKH